MVAPVLAVVVVVLGEVVVVVDCVVVVVVGAVVVDSVVAVVVVVEGAVVVVVVLVAVLVVEVDSLVVVVVVVSRGGGVPVCYSRVGPFSGPPAETTSASAVISAATARVSTPMVTQAHTGTAVRSGSCGAFNLRAPWTLSSTAPRSAGAVPPVCQRRRTAAVAGRTRAAVSRP